MNKPIIKHHYVAMNHKNGQFAGFIKGDTLEELHEKIESLKKEYKPHTHKYHKSKKNETTTFTA